MADTEFVTLSGCEGPATGWAHSLNDWMENKGLDVDDILFSASLYSAVGGTRVDLDACDLRVGDARLVSASHTIVVKFAQASGTWYAVLPS